MKRFIQVPSGGIPYVNTDFTEIFQNEHIVSYRGMLDSMNRDAFTGRNSGIIMKGCVIVSSTPISFEMNFVNSLIYLNGDFLDNDQTSLTASTIINSDTFYLYQIASQSTSRYAADLSTQVDTVEKGQFSYTTTEPANGQYIKFSNQGTSRYFKRIMKFATSDFGDIYITSNTQSFSATGLGFNDMEGFSLLNDQNQSSLMDLSGQFLRGQTYKNSTYEFVSPNWTEYTSVAGEQRISTPTSHLNYLFGRNFISYASNSFPGVTSVSLRINDIPRHQHLALATTFSMTHSHAVESTMGLTAYLDSWDAQSIANDTTIPNYTNVQLSYPSFIQPTGYIASVGVLNSGLIESGGNLRVGPYNPNSGLGIQSGFSYSYWKEYTDATSNYIDVLNTSFLREKYHDSNKSSYHSIYTHGVNSYYNLNPNNFVLYNSRLEYETNPNVTRANLYTHTHSFNSSTPLGIGLPGTPGAPHENRPSYRVMALYTKNYYSPVNIVIV